MHIVQQSLHLTQLTAIWSKNFRRASKVIHYCDRKDLDAHLLFNFTASALVFVGLLEFGDRVVVFVGEFPPLGAELAHVVECVLFEALLQR